MICVPTISGFFGISIAMFFDDHGPPHFHARHAQGSAKIRIRLARGDREQPSSPPTAGADLAPDTCTNASAPAPGQTRTSAPSNPDSQSLGASVPIRYPNPRD